MSERQPRWRLTLGASLALAAAGVWFFEPLLLVAAMAPIGFLAYSRLSRAPPAVQTIDLERRVTPGRTYPGGVVDVTLAITNRGDRSLLDVRLVDGVPPNLAVIEGSPRAGLHLAAGETVTIEYRLRARYGEHSFEPVTVRTHGLSAAATDTARIEATGDASLAAGLDAEEYPLGRDTTGMAGELTIDRGGDGLEFHGIRAYQPEDPASRINWRQYARDGTLSTIDFRQQEAVEVLVVLDARPSTRIAANETAPTGTELGVYVANEVLTDLRNNRNRAGLAVLGIDPATITATDPELAWVPPGGGRAADARMRRLLDTAAATTAPGAHPSEASQPIPDPLTIASRIDRGTQLLIVSPLTDDYPVDLASQLRQTGHAVTVYAPNVTARNTAGARVAAAERAVRVATLRREGTTVVDWHPSVPLSIAFDRPTDRRRTTLAQP